MNRIIIILLINIFFLPIGAYSCTCYKTNSISISMSNSRVVFMGKVVKISKIHYIKKIYNGRDYFNDTVFLMKVECKVNKVFKGKLKSKKVMTIITGLGNGDCGFIFSKGKNYLIFATKDSTHSKYIKGYDYTDACTRTSEYNNVENDKIENYLKIINSKSKKLTVKKEQ